MKEICNHSQLTRSIYFIIVPFQKLCILKQFMRTKVAVSQQ